MFKPRVTFNPGPSQLAPSTIQHIHDIAEEGILSVSHRSEEIAEMGHLVVEGVRKSLGAPDNFQVFFQASATMAMDTILRNLVRKKSFHFVQGAFSDRFYQTSVGTGHHASKMDCDWRRAIDWKSADIVPETELIAVTHVETSTGTIWPDSELRALRAAYPDALIALDTTCSLGGVHMDWSVADVYFSSVQKCLGLPSGMALLIVSDRAVAQAKRVEGFLGPWQSFSVMLEKMQRYQTLETPNIFLIALLGRVLRDWDMNKIHEETMRKSAFIQSQKFSWSSYQQDADWVAPTLGNFAVDDPAPWHQKARDAGLLIGKGYGKLQDKCVRIANFPAIEMSMLEELFQVLGQDAGMTV